MLSLCIYRKIASLKKENSFQRKSDLTGCREFYTLLGSPEVRNMRLFWCSRAPSSHPSL